MVDIDEPLIHGTENHRGLAAPAMGIALNGDSEFRVTQKRVLFDKKRNNSGIGFEDVFTKIEMCRRHYEAVGLGADFVEQFIR